MGGVASTSDTQKKDKWPLPDSENVGGFLLSWMAIVVFLSQEAWLQPRTINKNRTIGSRGFLFRSLFIEAIQEDAEANARDFSDLFFTVTFALRRGTRAT